MITFKATNGELLIALNENQAAAFEKAGLVAVVEEAPKKSVKTTEKE